LPNHPQPVPPIYQPEVAANAIVWAARNDRREVAVGFPTVLAIVGDKIAPSLLDRYLAKTNIQAQQTDSPVDPSRRDNLWRPVDDREDFGAHGDFDDRARATSPQWFVNAHRRWFAFAGLGGAALAWTAKRRRGS
jgi:hypothetical protein